MASYYWSHCSRAERNIYALLGAIQLSLKWHIFTNLIVIGRHDLEGKSSSMFLNGIFIYHGPQITLSQHELSIGETILCVLPRRLPACLPMDLRVSGISLFLRLSRNGCATFSSVVCVVFQFLSRQCCDKHLYTWDVCCQISIKWTRWSRCYWMVSGFPERLDQFILTQSEPKS